MTDAQLTDVEHIKSRSRHLRGTLVESLDNPLTGALADDDTHVCILSDGNAQPIGRR